MNYTKDQIFLKKYANVIKMERPEGLDPIPPLPMYPDYMMTDDRTSSNYRREITEEEKRVNRLAWEEEVDRLCSQPTHRSYAQETRDIERRLSVSPDTAQEGFLLQERISETKDEIGLEKEKEKLQDERNQGKKLTDYERADDEEDPVIDRDENRVNETARIGVSFEQYRLMTAVLLADDRVKLLYDGVIEVDPQMTDISWSVFEHSALVWEIDGEEVTATWLPSIERIVLDNANEGTVLCTAARFLAWGNLCTWASVKCVTVKDIFSLLTIDRWNTYSYDGNMISVLDIAKGIGVSIVTAFDRYFVSEVVIPSSLFPNKKFMVPEMKCLPAILDARRSDIVLRVDNKEVVLTLSTMSVSLYKGLLEMDGIMESSRICSMLVDPKEVIHCARYVDTRRNFDRGRVKMYVKQCIDEYSSYSRLPLRRGVINCRITIAQKIEDICETVFIRGDCVYIALVLQNREDNDSIVDLIRTPCKANFKLSIVRDITIYRKKQLIDVDVFVEEQIGTPSFRSGGVRYQDRRQKEILQVYEFYSFLSEKMVGRVLLG